MPGGGTAPFLDVPHEDVFTTSVWRYSRDGHSLFMQGSRGRYRCLAGGDERTPGQRNCSPRIRTRTSSGPGGTRTARLLAALALAVDNAATRPIPRCAKISTFAAETRRGLLVR